MVILDSNIKKYFNSYDFVILDYNREKHYVAYNISNKKNTRIILKLHYFICPNCSKNYKLFVKYLNYMENHFVRSIMKYSANPKTFLKKFIGYIANLARVISNNL